MAAAKKEKKNAMAVINQHISEGKFSNIYLLYGEERYLVNQYKGKLIDALTDKDDTLNFMKFGGNKFSESDFLEFCNEMPFFSDRRVALVESSGLFAKSSEELAKRLSQIPDTTIVVFVEEDVDSRYKLFKTVDKLGETLHFVTPDDKTLVTWVKGMLRSEKVTTTDTAIFNIIEHCHMDMYRIRNEVDKLIAFAGDKKQFSDLDVDNLCSMDAESRVFGMIDFIVAKKTEKAIKMYHDLLDNKESVIMINSCITKQFNKLLLVKLALIDGTDDAGISKIARCPSWAVKNYKAQCSNYTAERLKEIVEDCNEMDYKLKTGQLMDEAAVEVMILGLCK